MGGPPPAGRGGGPPFRKDTARTGSMQQGNRRVTPQKSNKGFIAWIKNFFTGRGKAKAPDLKKWTVTWVASLPDPKFETHLEAKVLEIKQNLFDGNQARNPKKLLNLKDEINRRRQQLVLRHPTNNQEISPRLEQLKAVKQDLSQFLADKKAAVQQGLKTAAEEGLEAKLPKLTESAAKLGLKESDLKNKSFEEKVALLEKAASDEKTALAAKRQQAQAAVDTAQEDRDVAQNPVYQKEHERDVALAKLEIEQGKVDKQHSQKLEKVGKKLQALEDQHQTLVRALEAAIHANQKTQIGSVDQQLQGVQNEIEDAQADLKKLATQKQALHLTHQEAQSTLKARFDAEIAKAKQTEAETEQQAFETEKQLLEKVNAETAQRDRELDAVLEALGTIKQSASEIRTTHLATSPLIENLVKIALLEKAWTQYSDFKIAPEDAFPKSLKNLLSRDEKEALVADWPILGATHVNGIMTRIQNKGWS